MSMVRARHGYLVAHSKQSRSVCTPTLLTLKAKAQGHFGASYEASLSCLD